MRMMYGYRNVAFYPGPRPTGYAVFFRTEDRRNKALAWMRDKAIAGGLEKGASTAGIYPVTRPDDTLSVDEAEELDREGSVRTP